MFFDIKVNKVTKDQDGKEVFVNRRLQQHFNSLMSKRQLINRHEQVLLEQYGGVMQTNASLNDIFWSELDRQVVALRAEQVGMEILDDLMPVQRVLNVGKTAYSYSKVGDIAKDVSVSIDGQAPYSFDHTEYDSDGDPIPMFSAGFGVNWRHQEGLQSINMDLVMDSQEAKLRVYNGKLVSYLLDGADNISVDGKAGQGLRNHRNTKKINLSAGGVGIDLTTATAAQMVAFFTTGAFSQTAIDNRVSRYDVVWVSPQVKANLDADYVVNGVVNGTVADQIIRKGRVGEFRETFALDGNEFLGYVRRSDVVQPLNGMTTGVVALPRPLPNSNYNFQILGAMGVSVKSDSEDRSGVIYGGDLDG